MHHRKTYTNINFQQNRGSRSLIPVSAHKFICKLHKFATCNENFCKIPPFGHALPLTDIQADFEINRPVRYRNTTKRNYFHRRQTDRRTDIQTDRQTDVAYDNNR